MATSSRTIEINRAPVLTLWASVVAERLGHSRDESLSLGKAVAGLNAHSKGVRLGLYDRTDARKTSPERRPPRVVTLLGRTVPAAPAEGDSEEVRAMNHDKPIDPRSVDRYLRSAFGPALPAARQAMESLAARFDPDDLERDGFTIYEQFRPAVPSGKRGWGAKGELDLAQIRSLARHRGPAH